MSFLINLIKDETPFHQHKTYEIIVYLGGTGLLRTEETDIPVSPGKIMIIPPGVPHSSLSEGELPRIFINGEVNHFFNLASPTVISDSANQEGTLLAKMIYHNRYANAEYVAALIGAFVHFLTQRLKMEDELTQVISDIAHEISNRFYDSNINLCELLKKSGYAEDYIRAKFKKITGKTPTEFLTNIRIYHACYLIDTYHNTLSLSEIAEKCGYTDYVYFSRRFKQVTGISPRNYMKR